MDRRSFLRACGCGALCISAPGRARAPARIVFLNPGSSLERTTGPHWPLVSQFMGIAARQLGLHLETLWSEFDHLLMLRQAEAVARRPEAPDYVVIVNQKLAAPQMLRALQRSPAKVFVIHDDLTPEQRSENGHERTGIRNWIGTATDDARQIGVILMQELYRQLGREEPQIIGITGDNGTAASHEHAEGVAALVRRKRRGHIHQLAYGDWSDVDGEDKARVLLARYPATNVVWAANDAMALGALRAVKKRDPRQGRVLVGSIGGGVKAVQSIVAGGLAASAAGSYMIGAWAAVLLYDYHHGRDFAAHGGRNQKLDYLAIVNRDNAALYDQAVFRSTDTLDFRRHSKHLNPRPGPYDFGFKRLLRQPG